MMNRPIDALVVSAALKRSAFGERVYRDVVLRRRDGAEIRMGQVSVSNQLGEVLVPGREGCFSFHDLLGATGLHAYRPVGGQERVAFPMLIERLFAWLAIANLMLVTAWLASQAGFQLVPLTVGVLATMAWATCRALREAVMHDFKYESQAACTRSHRQAVLRSHA